MIEYPVRIKFLYDKLTGGGSSSSSASSSGGAGGSPEKENAKENKKQSGSLLRVVGQLGLIAAVLKALQGILEPIFDLINILVYVVAANIIKPITDIVDAIKNGDWMKALGGIAEAIIPGLDIENLQEGINSAWEQMKNVGSWIMDNIITPGWENLKMIGQWIMDNIIIPGWENLKMVGQWIFDNVISPSWEALKNVGDWIFNNIIQPAWQFLSNVGSRIWEEILKPAWEYLSDVGSWIWEQILKPAWEWFKDIGTTIYENILKPAFQTLADSISGAWNWLKGLFKDKKEGTRAMGGIIPKDGMYYMHSGEVVSRGNNSNVTNTVSPTINISVSGRMGTREMDVLARRLQQELNSYQRW